MFSRAFKRNYCKKNGKYSTFFTINKRSIHKSEFNPQTIFNENMRVFAAPQKYIQGPNVLSHLCSFLPIIAAKNPVIIASKNGKEKVKESLGLSFETARIEPGWVDFLGECSTFEVNRITNQIKDKHSKVDSIIGIGGGKLMDASKYVAKNFGLPLIICPSLASNDAPCSSRSIMYTEVGEPLGPEFFKTNPNLVVVDSEVILNSPLRTLVAGMGDAIATFYEAEVCFNNPLARNMLGSRPTLSAIRLAELCRDTLFTHSIYAIDAMKNKTLTPSFEYVIEANTLLSSLGFESGGLAGAHAIAKGLTLIPHVENNCMHGEMVAIGLLCQLIMLGYMSEAERVANYNSVVGLPVHFAQLQINIEKDDISKVLDSAATSFMMQNMPMTVTPAILSETFEKVNKIGSKCLEKNGDRTFIPRV